MHPLAPRMAAVVATCLALAACADGPTPAVLAAQEAPAAVYTPEPDLPIFATSEPPYQPPRTREPEVEVGRPERPAPAGLAPAPQQVAQPSQRRQAPPARGQQPPPPPAVPAAAPTARSSGGAPVWVPTSPQPRSAPAASSRPAAPAPSTTTPAPGTSARPARPTGTASPRATASPRRSDAPAGPTWAGAKWNGGFTIENEFDHRFGGDCDKQTHHHKGQQVAVEHDFGTSYGVLGACQWQNAGTRRATIRFLMEVRNFPRDSSRYFFDIKPHFVRTSPEALRAFGNEIRVYEQP